MSTRVAVVPTAVYTLSRRTASTERRSPFTKRGITHWEVLSIVAHGRYVYTLIGMSAHVL